MIRAWHVALIVTLMTVPARLLAGPATVADFDRAAATAKAALLVDPGVALHRADAAEHIARSFATRRAREQAFATVQRLRGEAYVQLDRLDRAGPLLGQALMLARRSAPGTRLEAEVLMSSGSLHAGRGEPAAAFAEYQAAYRIFQATADTRDQAIVLLCISMLYGEANDYVAALKYVDQAIAIEGTDQKLMLSAYNNQAAALEELGRYREAESGYRRALVIADRIRSSQLQARLFGNIARLRLRIGDVGGADKLVQAASAVADHQDAAAVRPQITGVAAQVAYQQHDYRRAARLIEQRFAGVDLATTTVSFREAHQTAYDTYRALNDAPHAVAHLAALKRLDDQATRLATSANSALAAAQFDFKNQELRLAVLKAAEANRKANDERQRARTQRLVFLGLAAATAIIIALLGFWLATLRRSRNRVRAAADDLAITNAALGKALAAKTEFLATTSHEIRTPLNGILGMTQVMLADPQLAAETRERIGVVHGAGVTMRALVDDILDVAKMETGNLTVERAPFDLAATLAEAAKLWAGQARDKGVGFALDLADCPGWIEGDAARVRQIAFNLLSNALKFTARGQIALHVAHHVDRYAIIIEDSGIGIAADKIEDIFESFRQADAGTTRQFGGTGLGLAICRNLARAMGGEVTVASIPGKGSTFTVTLPLIVAPRTVDAVDRAAAESGGVVIVDANPITRAMLKTVVAARAPSVVTVASLAEAATIAGGAAIMLVDQSAITDEAAFASLAADISTAITILWRGEAPEPIARTARVVAKPIGGPALLAILFGTPSQQTAQLPLVQRAA